MADVSIIRKRLFFNVFSVLFFLILTVVVHFNLKAKESLQIRSILEHTLNQFLVSVSDKVQGSAEKLRTIASFTVLTENLKSQNFETYVNEFIKDSQGLVIVEWQPVVPNNQRIAFEDYVTNTIYPDFYLWEPDHNGEKIRAKQRDEHVPVLHFVSRHETSNTRGLDLAWSDTRMESKWLARDSGEAQLSVFFNIVLSPESPNGPLGFAITVPAYQTGIVPKSISLRNENIAGYIAGVFSLEETLTEQFAILEPNGLAVSITSPSNSLAFNSAPREEYRPDLYDNAISSNLQMLGQEWLVTIWPKREFEATSLESRSTFLPFMIFVFGMLLVLSVNRIFRVNDKLMSTKLELERALSQVSLSEKHYAQLSQHDSLTGLLNRRAFVEKIEQEISRSSRYGHDLCLLIADIDEFKKVNDTYGHLTGDEVLRRFGKICRKCCREQDIVCRFGGEEFAVLMVETSIEEGLTISQRLLEEISLQEIADFSSESMVKITFSGGLTIYKDGDDTESMLSRADIALYESKHKGRNQLTVG